MLPYHSHLSHIALVIFFILVLLYAYYEARGILYGPRIMIPPETTLVHDPFITIRGKAERIVELRMNGSAVSVTEDGTFEEPYLLATGYNQIVFEASDRYKHTDTEVLEVIYEPIEIAPTPKIE